MTLLPSPPPWLCWWAEGSSSCRTRCLKEEKGEKVPSVGNRAESWLSPVLAAMMGRSVASFFQSPSQEDPLLPVKSLPCSADPCRGATQRNGGEEACLLGSAFILQLVVRKLLSQRTPCPVPQVSWTRWWLPGKDPWRLPGIDLDRAGF